MSNRITFGADADNPLFSFDDSSLRSVNSSTTVDIVGAELFIDTFTATLDYNTEFANLAAIVFSPADYDGVVSSDGYLFCADASASGDLRNLPHGTIIRQYHDGVLIGKFYLKNLDRIGTNLYKAHGVSAIGLIDTKQHLGGVYNGTTTFAQLVADIIGNSIPYTIEDSVATTPIYGWLPIDTARNNLHKLMFAEGVSLTKDANGDIVFSYLYSSANPDEIPSNRIYLGGQIDYTSPATAVEITEHLFFSTAGDETVQLFDNADSVDTADHLLVPFSDAPVHDITATGLTVEESGTNYAIVSGRGTLEGKKYQHNTTVIRKSNNAVGAENVVSVTDDCLVSLQNSANVAKRVLAYYSSRKRISAGILLQGEKAGRQVRFADPFGDESTGYIASMEITASSKLKGQAQIITDYSPTGQGNNYSNTELLTGTGDWIVPDGITEVKAIIGGGGHGGYNGGNGADATSYSGGAGGVGGNGGEGGKVLSVVIPVTPGQVISYSCGIGGEAGQAGGDTTFGTYTSADGVVAANGWSDIFTGNIYGAPGAKGVDGGKGADSAMPFAYFVRDGIYYWGGALAETRMGYQGACYGGYGGGAALVEVPQGATSVNAGGDGYTGGAQWNAGVYYGDFGGQGGFGAGHPYIAAQRPAILPGADATQYCCGGGGGNGGGGGGAPGNADRGSTGTPGYGGFGSVGGRGGNGCINIYY